jgi:hypothetical protein
MTTILNSAFKINGVLDTGETVITNLNKLAQACGCWITYDIHQGKWAVIINQAGSSVASFTDSNIIGGINISGTGITELYNSVEIEFPHKDLSDQKDYIKFDIPDADRFPNEPDNLLSITTNLINDPIQAELIAARELKQSRIDKVIQFRTDYSKIGLKAGNLIDVTSTPYGYTNKVFRIIKINEEDVDDGSIQINITALEYNADIYSTSGLVRAVRTKNNSIVAKTANAYATNSDNSSNTAAVTNSLLNPSNAALIALLMNALTRTGASVPGLTPTVSTFTTGVIYATQPDLANHEVSLGYSITLPYTGTYKTTYSINWGGTGDPGVDGVSKTSEIVLRIGGTRISTSPADTGDGHVQLFEDHFLDAVWYGVAGQTVTYHFIYNTNWGGSIGAGYTALFIINGETKFVSR